jgi:predicted ATPase/DNA-binding SARP family transcriptional activator
VLQPKTVSRLDVGVLGPFEIWLGGTPLKLRHKQRALAAVLALRAGEIVSKDRLIDDLWGEHAPRAAVGSLQNLVSQLRTMLGADVLRTRAPGYVLDVDSEHVDARRFERLVAEAATARTADQRAAILRRALALWRGPPLADLASEPFAQLEIAHLEERRLAAREELIDAELELGHHATLLADLEALVAAHPFRERLRGQLMLALYRCGQQSAALECYRQTARLLADELGIEPGPELRALERAILNQDASLAAREQVAGNLPAPPDRLIGRRRELDELAAMISSPDTRLVTLTGPGGSGKTRLALEVAANVEEESGLPAFFVDLAPIGEPELVLSAVANALGVQHDRATPLAETVVGFLHHRRLLVVLDNFEHVLDAGPDIAALLAGAPGLIILATSRSPLHLRGEWRYKVEPLPIEDAITLFAERARAVQTAFTDDSPVDAICQRLDRLPLAIELAAARTKALTPEELLATLEARLALLTAGPRDVPERQRTLRATIEWSYELLDERERELFARLAVFVGGWTIEAAAKVCGADLDSLESLAGKSLVRPEDGRFSMLETIREYALERLVRVAEPDRVRDRHAAYFLRLFESGDRAAWEGQLPVATHINRSMREQGNAREALDWLRARGDHGAEARLASALDRIWAMNVEEGRRVLERALAYPELPVTVRARTLAAAAHVAAVEGDLVREEAFLDEALRLYTELGDRREVASCLASLSLVATHEGDNKRARVLLDDAERVAAEVGDDVQLGAILACRAEIHLYERDYALARSLFEKALERFRRGRNASAEGTTLTNLGLVAVEEGRLSAAISYFRETLRLHEQMPLISVGDCLDGLAAVAVAQNDPQRAAFALGATEAWRSRTGISQDAFESTIRGKAAAAAFAALGEDTYQALFWEGKRVEIDDAAKDLLSSIRTDRQ